MCPGRKASGLFCVRAAERLFFFLLFTGITSWSAPLERDTKTRDWLRRDNSRRLCQRHSFWSHCGESLLLSNCIFSHTKLPSHAYPRVAARIAGLPPAGSRQLGLAHPEQSRIS